MILEDTAFASDLLRGSAGCNSMGTQCTPTNNPHYRNQTTIDLISRN